MTAARMVRRGLVAAAAAALLSSAALPAGASTTVPFGASFDEGTTFLVCPLGSAPLGAVCFHGEGDGSASPGGAGRHVFDGYAVAAPGGPCLNRLVSYSTATLSTASGEIYFTATGYQCPPPIGETGTWTITGGSGAYVGATGGGTYVTDRVGVAVALQGTVRSTTTYSGTLTLP